MARSSNKPKDLLKEAQIHFKDFYPDQLLDMRKSNNIKGLNEKLQEFVKQNVKGVTSSQLRKLYDKIINSDTLMKIQLLRPLFAYTIARQNSPESKRMMLLIDDLASRIKTDDDVVGFHLLAESLVAYHKYYEVLKNA